MPYDERLADELRERLDWVDAEVTEKRMFGGLAFMVAGNLTVAASRARLRGRPRRLVSRALAFVATLPAK